MLRTPGPGVGLPQPAPPPRAPSGAGPGRDVLDGPRRGSAREPSSRSAASTRCRYPHPSVEDIDLGRAAARAASGSLARPVDPGHAPQGVDVPLDGLDRLRPAGHALGSDAGAEPPAGLRARSTSAGATGSARAAAAALGARPLWRPAAHRRRARCVLVGLNGAFYAPARGAPGLPARSPAWPCTLVHHLVASPPCPPGWRSPSSTRCSAGVGAGRTGGRCRARAVDDGRGAAA